MTAATNPNPWVKAFQPRPGAALRLFCLPYAGGGASIFRLWGQALPATVEVAAVQLPGREARFRDKPFSQLAPLADELVQGLGPLLAEKPYAFFGHSMGASIAFEVCRRLERLGVPRQPLHLFVSGRHAPTVPDEDEPMWNLPRAEFIEALRDYAGTPEEVLANAELMELVEPLLRADFELIETYRYAPDGQRLRLPMTAFGGTTDEDVPPPKLAPWELETSGPFRSHILEGGHFFLNERREELLALVARELAPYLARL